MVYHVIAWFFNYVDRMAEREKYAKIHEILYSGGWVNQISFYGTLEKPYDDRHVQARIEVISKEPITETQLDLCYTLFQYKAITREYTLYLLTPDGLTEVKI